MALIKCKKCGNKISEYANKCPKCGYNIKKNDNIKLTLIIMIMVLIFSVLIIVNNGGK